MTKPGRQFELAVSEFAKSLDEKATVLFDHRIPDRDTGTPRQVDVWIEANLMGHWPVGVLVSCKDHKRPVSISGIGTFQSELRSVGASCGVMYSSSGFSKPAIQKARAIGITCCVLLRDEPPRVPECLWFTSYLFRPSVRFDLVRRIGKFTSLDTWNDLLSIKDIGVNHNSMMQLIDGAYDEAERASRDRYLKAPGFPEDLVSTLILDDSDCEDNQLELQIGVHWKGFMGRLESNRITGSFCLNNGSFRGNQACPVIDLKGSDPGEGWEEIDRDSFTQPKRGIVAMCFGTSASKSIRDALGGQPIPAGE